MGSSCLLPFTDKKTGCYHKGPLGMTWLEAEDYCSSLDAHLAKPNTIEVTYIQSTAQQVDLLLKGIWFCQVMC